MYSITVIVPIYNTGRFLERCLDSIAKQTMQDIQVVLVDDGSTDESADIYQEYLNKYTNFELIKKENAGLGFARNSGLEVARGRYVAFLDSDDYVAPDFYEKMYRAIMLNKADTCVAGYTLLKNDGEKILKELQANVIAGVGVVQEVLPDILGAQPTERNDVVLGMSVWKNLFSVDVIKKYQIRFCSERQFISEDAIFAIDYYRFAKKVVILNECGYFYCEN